MIALARMTFQFLFDLVGLAVLAIRSRRSVEAENLLLRRQLALYKERGVKSRRIEGATPVSLAWLSRWCDWRACLIVVRPETVISWHRAGWRLLWRRKSRPGRPRIPVELRRLIQRMATGNPLWGEARIANELLLKRDIRVSPRTVRTYMPERPRGPQKLGCIPQGLRIEGAEIAATQSDGERDLRAVDRNNPALMTTNDVSTRAASDAQAGPGRQEEPTLAPAVDIFEDAHGITVQAEMPGVAKDRLNIQADRNSLLLEGEVAIDMPAGMEPVHADVRATRDRRSFALSGGLDTDRIEALLKDGVLTLRLPKRAEYRPRRLEVRAS